MYLAPDGGENGVGHIRIVDRVTVAADEVRFHTVESTRTVSPTGPVARWWRWRDQSTFADLEEEKGGWTRASDWDQTAQFVRRFQPVEQAPTR
jgi:hypothetical protein